MIGPVSPRFRTTTLDDLEAIPVDVGHEELYVVVRGHARFTIDGEDLDAPAGTLVFLPEPEAKRVATALEDGTIVMAVGGAVGEA